MKYDESAYLLLGQNLLAGHGLTMGYADHPELPHPPLYPIVVGIVNLGVKNLELASDVASALFATLMLIPCFFLARRIYGERCAWLSAIYLSLFPAFCVSVLYWGSMTETLYAFLFLSALAALLAGLEDQKPVLSGAAGGCLALAYLTRPEGYFVFLALLGYIAVRSIFDSAGLRRMSHHLICYIAAFVLLASPYLFYLHTYSGHWTISGKSQISWEIGEAAFSGDMVEMDKEVAGLDQSGEVRWASAARENFSLIKELWAHPLHVIAKAQWAGQSLLHQLFSPPVFWAGTVPLILLGLFAQSWSRRRLLAEILFLTAAAITVLTFSVLGVDQVRFLAALFPIGIMWMARGTIALEDFVHGTLKLRPTGSPPDLSGRWIRWSVPCAVVLSIVCIMRPAIVRGRQGEPDSFELKQVGLWLRDHSSRDAAVMNAEAAIAIYADRKYVPSPRAAWPEFLSYARAKKATHLVLSDEELVHRPHMKFLVEEGSPELELIHEIGEPGKRVYVFQFLPARLTSPATPALPASRPDRTFDTHSYQVDNG